MVEKAPVGGGGGYKRLHGPKDCGLELMLHWGERKWTGQALKLNTLALTILDPEMLAKKGVPKPRKKQGKVELLAHAASVFQQEQKTKRLSVSVLQLSKGPWHPSLH